MKQMVKMTQGVRRKVAHITNLKFWKVVLGLAASGCLKPP